MADPTVLARIPKILARLSALYAEYDQEAWSDALERQSVTFADDPGRNLRVIMRYFGGMGSLNDVVLFKDGVIPMAANEEQERLKDELFRLCRRAIA